MKKMLMVASVASMIGQFNMNNLQVLKNLGYLPHVACNFKDTSFWNEDKIIKFIDELKKMDIPYYQVDFSRNPFDIKKDIISYIQLNQLVTENNYDFIHCHTPVASVIARIVAHKKNIIAIYTAHGFHFFKGAPKRNWLIYYPIEKFLSRWTEVLITINKEDYNRARKKFHSKQVVYIPGVGVDTEKFRICKVDVAEKRKSLGIPLDAFVLFSVIEHQNCGSQDVIIDALRQVNNPNIYYLIVGEQSFQEKYEQLIKDYHLNNNIKFLELENNLDELCELADCIINLSINNEINIILLEAMASGLPFIFSYVNGTKDYIRNEIRGYDIKIPLSVAEVSNAINKMYSDITFRELCGINNLNMSKHFNIITADKIKVKLFNSLGGYSHVLWLLQRQKIREQLGIQLDDYVIISVGELNHNKNHGIIIEALKNVNDKKIKYIICGKGILEQYYKAKIQEIGLEKQVLLLGYQTDIKSYLQASDVFAFPSKREGLGLSAIEAMACGLPLLTSDIHGINDYSINSVTGYKCSSYDVNAFAEYITKMKADMYTSNRSKNNIELSKQFDICKVSKRMNEIYSSYMKVY